MSSDDLFLFEGGEGAWPAVLKLCMLETTKLEFFNIRPDEVAATSCSPDILSTCKGEEMKESELR